jgi:hypothetical protein
MEAVVNKPNNRFDLWIIALCLAVITVFLLNKACKPQYPIFTPDKQKDSLKAVISHQLKERDSLIQLSGISEQLRDSIIIRWRTVIKPIIYQVPCDSILPIVVNTCDSIITADSLHISDLKQVIKIDSGIISNQSKVIKMDSVMINRLSFKVDSLGRKAQKFKGQRNGFAGASVLFGSLLFIR